MGNFLLVSKTTESVTKATGREVLVLGAILGGQELVY